MKTSMTFSLLLVLSLVCISDGFAQDVVSVKPAVDANHDPCAFNFTFSNHNAGQKYIDGVRFDLISTNTTFDMLQPPLHWSLPINPPTPTTEQSATSDNQGIAPGASLGGFILDYAIDQNPFDQPVTIRWVALSGGIAIDSAEIQLVCTQYQSYDKLDTVTVIPSTSGPDPCFSFTLIDRNSQQGGSLQAPIGFVSFEILNGGTMRPSKITPPPGWIIDSVTSTIAYFHLPAPNELNNGQAAGPFNVCLRANPNVNKYSFVWRAYDGQFGFIDRDTLANIPNTATSSPTSADTVSVLSHSGCLFNVALKNYHVANNPLGPSRIVRFMLSSQTSGVTFASAPGAPPHWSKVVTSTGDSVIYTSDSTGDGIPSGTIAQFSFSMAGSTSSGFSLAWETDQAGAPFPPKFSLLSSGTINLNCTVAVPATDSAFFSPTVNECSFKLTVKNTHNIKPQSNITQITISIPKDSGQLTPTGNSGSSQWEFTNPSPTTIKFTAPPGDPGMPPDPTASQDMTFTLSPKVPGQNITATWTTVDDQGNTTGTGTGFIKCSPPITICDTFVYEGIVDPTHNTDSCRENKFTLHNPKNTDIVRIDVVPTNAWRIDSARVQDTGWTVKVSPYQATFTPPGEGLHPGQSETFFFKFIAYFLPGHLVDTFSVITTTTDLNQKICTTMTPINSCVSHPIDTTAGVAAHADYIGVSNFAVHPNPARGAAEITFDVNTQERVTITIIDELGRTNATISSKIMGAGSYQIPCVLNDLPDGVYYLRMQTELGVKTVKLILTK